MYFKNQTIIPAAYKMKDFEKLVGYDKYEYIILLNIHVAQLRSVLTFAKKKEKKILLHADMIHGLKSDDYASEYLCQIIKPAGLISTKPNVIHVAKKNSLIAIQRLFLIDLFALERSYKTIEQSQPDFVEVLPGVIPHLIKEVNEVTKIPIIAGGLIRTEKEMNAALKAGAQAITTRIKTLW